jgi:rubrerythrin
MGASIIGFLLFIRYQDIPQPAPVSPFRHLEERKAAIYENLRDLQFEYRLNKLSDQDYQASKVQLQKELARVLEETDRIKAQMGQPAAVKATAAAVQTPSCAKCGVKFQKVPKFCPECGAAQ